jgi:NADPH2 dehydrogenase
MTSALFSPFRLAGLELANRIVVSPMCQYSADDGCANGWHLAHIGMLSNSGAGLVVLEATAVERMGRITHGCLGLYSDACEVALTKLITQCRHIGSAKFGIQIGHSGRKGSSHKPWDGGHGLKHGEDAWETIAPSAIPFGDAWPAPREASEADIDRVRDAFVNTARRAVRIGFDAIELHGAHGYLLHSFLSPVSNRRADRYGGSLENRMRLMCEVARVVRAVVPKHIALGIRLSADDWRSDGLSLDDNVAVAKALKAEGLDYICCSSGGVTADTRNPATPGYNVPLAERIRKEAGIATRAVGLITEPAQAEEIVKNGQADLVELARAMLDDPHWGWHAAAELGGEVKLPPQYLRAGGKFWSRGAARR